MRHLGFRCAEIDEELLTVYNLHMVESTSHKNKSNSSNTKNILTIILLVLVYPIGLIFMWFWTKWQLWLKIVISLPILFAIYFISQINNNYSATLKAINPSKQFSLANNTKRLSDTQQIAYGVSAYRDQKGSLPEGIVSEPREISSGGADICDDLIAIMQQIPVDPLIGNKGVSDCNTPYNTGYLISVNDEGRIVVSAPKAELNETISKTY